MYRKHCIKEAMRTRKIHAQEAVTIVHGRAKWRCLLAASSLFAKWWTREKEEKECILPAGVMWTKFVQRRYSTHVELANEPSGVHCAVASDCSWDKKYNVRRAPEPISRCDHFRYNGLTTSLNADNNTAMHRDSLTHFRAVYRKPLATSIFQQMHSSDELSV